MAYGMMYLAAEVMYLTSGNLGGRLGATGDLCQYLSAEIIFYVNI